MNGHRFSHGFQRPRPLESGSALGSSRLNAAIALRHGETAIWLAHITLLIALGSGCSSGPHLVVDELCDLGCIGAGDSRSGDAAKGDAVTGDPSGDAANRCPTYADANTLGLYSMEDLGDLSSSTNSPDGVVVGTGLSLIPGPEHCGNAMAFPAGPDDDYAYIPDDAAWRRATGSIDFWVRLAAALPETAEGIISRDAQLELEPGHLTFYSSHDGNIAMRLQTAPVTNHYLCTVEPVARETWIHVGLNFGPPRTELWVDGTLVPDGGTFVRSDRYSYPCGGVATIGVDGNQNPWVLGAGSGLSGDGAPDPVIYPLRGGAIDEVRFSDVRRDFSSFSP